MKCNNCKPEGKCDRHMEFEEIVARLNHILIAIEGEIRRIDHYVGPCTPYEELQTAYDRITEAREWLQADLAGE